MNELPITPALLLDSGAAAFAAQQTEGPAFHQLTDEQKVLKLASAFFSIAYDTCHGSAIETTRLGMAAAGHFAGVVFGSLHAEGGASVTAKRKHAEADIARAFQQGIAQARANARAVLEEAGEADERTCRGSVKLGTACGNCARCRAGES